MARMLSPGMAIVRAELQRGKGGGAATYTAAILRALRSPRNCW